MTAKSNVVLLAQASADPSVKINVFLTVFPGTQDGSFRVDVGSPNDTKDGLGQTWWSDSGMVLTGIYVELAGDYPNWPGLAWSPYRSQIQSVGYTYGDDWRIRLRGLEDGIVKVHLWFGLPYQGCAVGGDIRKCADADPEWHSNVDILTLGLDGQLTTVKSKYNFESVVNYKHGVATDLIIPGYVVNGKFELALMVNNPQRGGTSRPSPLLNGLEISRF